MSGVITPLIDTLLHQVLGKRGDAPVIRNEAEPVRPLTPNSALRALHSDSRLESGRAGGTLPQSGVSPASGRASGELPQARLPASTTTRFSPAARTIADVLLKFPAPPSVIRPAAPLSASGASLDATQLAPRLQAGIETSGLFYEAHLARWFRGELSRGMLLREPQMQFAPRLPSTSSGAAGTAPTGGFPPPPQAAGSGAAASASPVPAMAALSFRPLAAGDALSEVAARDLQLASQQAQAAQSAQGKDDVLQQLVRHQLEMMVTPVIRWEGDVWSGLFMALTLHVPPEAEREPRDGGPEEDAPEGSWHSELTLRLASLGELGVRLWLRERSLALEIHASEASVFTRLEAGRADFESRLRRCGLDDVRVSVMRDEHGDRRPGGAEPAGFEGKA